MHEAIMLLESVNLKLERRVDCTSSISTNFLTRTATMLVTRWSLPAAFAGALVRTSVVFAT